MFRRHQNQPEYSNRAHKLTLRNLHDNITMIHKDFEKSRDQFYKELEQYKNRNGLLAETQNQSNTNCEAGQRIKLCEEKGKTSRYIEAEVAASGDILINCQDIGEGLQKAWGDSNYEFSLKIHNTEKDKVLSAFRQSYPELFKQVEELDTNKTLLTLIKNIYSGHFHAINEIRFYLELRGIPVEFNSYI